MAKTKVRPAPKPSGLNPAEVFEKYQSRLDAERELINHAWNLEEVEKLQAEAGRDYEAGREWAALLPFVEASHQRGDFLYKWEFDRELAQEYLDERGIVGEAWSGAEMRTIAGTPELSGEYLGEVQKANREGRLFLNEQAAVYGHFAGEMTEEGTPGHDKFKRELNAKLERLDNFRKAAQLLKEAQDKAEAWEREKVGAQTILRMLQDTLKKVLALDHKRYPVRDLLYFDDLEQGVAILAQRLGVR